MGFLQRIHDAMLGSRNPDGSTVSSVIRETGRLAPGELVQERGPFDEPPREPIDLDPDALPWELRSDSEK